MNTDSEAKLLHQRKANAGDPVSPWYPCLSVVILKFLESRQQVSLHTFMQQAQKLGYAAALVTLQMADDDQFATG